MTADAFLGRVEEALRDLPWSQRRDLVSELRGHLAELPPDTDLEERLGKPETYAAELRAAAGLERRSGAVAFVRARRPRNVLVTAVALVVVALAIGSAAFIQTYQPLAFGGPSTGHGPVSVAFHPGLRFSVGMDVENNGRFTVRVLGVPHSSGPFAGLPVSARVMMSRDFGENRVGTMICKGGGSCLPVFFRPGGPYVPFRPFDLAPGKERALLLTGVYGDCSTNARNLSPISVPDLPVRYSFLWRTATASIPLPKVQEIIPPSGGCLSGVAAARHLTGGESHLFRAGTIRVGARVFCLSHGLRVAAAVPKRGQSAAGTAVSGNGPVLVSNSATLRVSTRTDGSVVADCR